jgi:hypothetical protein
MSRNDTRTETCDWCGGDAGYDCRCVGAEQERCEADERENPVPYTFPVTRSMRVAGLYAELAQLHRRIANFYTDPMTMECGCTADFQDDFDRKERRLLAELHRVGKLERDEEAMAIALCGLVAYMP